MNLLFYRWGSASENFLYDALVKEGHQIVTVERPCTNYISDMELAWELIQTIQKKQVQGIISYNYFPIISSVCETTHILYFAWIYDCPHYTLFAHQAKLSCNRIYTFDKDMCDRLRFYGVSNIWHLPLAAHVDAFTKVIADSSEKAKKKYQCDISFVGSMYTGKYDYYDDNLQARAQLSQEEKDILEEYIDSGIFTYGESYLKKYQLFKDQYAEKMDKWAEDYQVAFGKDFYVKPGEAFLSSVLENKITVEERRRLFTELSHSGHAFHLYTNSDLTGMDEALIKANQGIVHYETEMPLVLIIRVLNILRKVSIFEITAMASQCKSDLRSLT